MENLRWILIFAGVAILILLYLSGRQTKTTRRQSDALHRDANTPSGTDQNTFDPLMGDSSMGESMMNDSRIHDSAMNEQGLRKPRTTDPSFSDPLEDFNLEMDNSMEDPLERPGGQGLKTRKSTATGIAKGGLSNISSKIEAFGKKLSPKRRARVAASESSNEKRNKSKGDNKIVTLHVAMPEGQLINGGQLLAQFEQRGYHYGDMNIFHSMHDGRTVFSIAKMVMPGTFDINDLDSFQTPGVSLILQLPGPVPADVAFEVLLSEAHDIADAVGANVLDSDRSTLSKQTVQHMREGIYEYMHRQKYFSGVPS
jgi:cell division protein ZipA